MAENQGFLGQVRLYSQVMFMQTPGVPRFDGLVIHQDHANIFSACIQLGLPEAFMYVCEPLQMPAVVYCLLGLVVVAIAHQLALMFQQYVRAQPIGREEQLFTVCSCARVFFHANVAIGLVCGFVMCLVLPSKPLINVPPAPVLTDSEPKQPHSFVSYVPRLALALAMISTGWVVLYADLQVYAWLWFPVTFVLAHGFGFYQFTQLNETQLNETQLNETQPSETQAGQIQAGQDRSFRIDVAEMALAFLKFSQFQSTSNMGKMTCIDDLYAQLWHIFVSHLYNNIGLPLLIVLALAGFLMLCVADDPVKVQLSEEEAEGLLRKVWSAGKAAEE